MGELHKVIERVIQLDNYIAVKERVAFKQMRIDLHTAIEAMTREFPLRLVEPPQGEVGYRYMSPQNKEKALSEVVGWFVTWLQPDDTP